MDNKINVLFNNTSIARIPVLIIPDTNPKGELEKIIESPLVEASKAGTNI